MWFVDYQFLRKFYERKNIGAGKASFLVPFKLSTTESVYVKPFQQLHGHISRIFARAYICTFRANVSKTLLRSNNFVPLPRIFMGLRVGSKTSRTTPRTAPLSIMFPWAFSRLVNPPRNVRAPSWREILFIYNGMLPLLRSFDCRFFGNLQTECANVLNV